MLQMSKTWKENEKKNVCVIEKPQFVMGARKPKLYENIRLARSHKRETNKRVH